MAINTAIPVPPPQHMDKTEPLMESPADSGAELRLCWFGNDLLLFVFTAEAVGVSKKSFAPTNWTNGKQELYDLLPSVFLVYGS